MSLARPADSLRATVPRVCMPAGGGLRPARSSRSPQPRSGQVSTRSPRKYGADVRSRCAPGEQIRGRLCRPDHGPGQSRALLGWQPDGRALDARQLHDLPPRPRSGREARFQIAHPGSGTRSITAIAATIIPRSRPTDEHRTGARRAPGAARPVVAFERQKAESVSGKQDLAARAFAQARQYPWPEQRFFESSSKQQPAGAAADPRPLFEE